MKVFAIFDSKAESYLPPFMMDTVGMAERGIADLCRDPEHNFSKHAEDFTLFYIADWDELSGKYVQKNSFTALGNLAEFKARVKGEVLN